MRPPKRDKKDYERVPVGEFVTGIIEEVQYAPEHVFKGFSGGPDVTAPGIRLKFKFDGCQYAHYSRYMKFNVGEKSNLYKKYLLKLVENAVPDMDVDLDILNGMKVKTLWADNGDFQNLENIFPVGEKVKADAVVPTTEEPPIVDDGSEAAPF